VQVTSQSGKTGMATVGQFHFQQVRQGGAGLEFNRHVVVENPHATLGFDPPQTFKLRRQLARIKGLLRGQALLFTGHVVLAHLAEMALEQVAVDQRIAVVEGQGQPAIGLAQLVQHRQDRMGFGQPFEHGVAEHQVIGFGELAEEVLPGRLDKGRVLSGLGKSLARALEHRFGGFGEGHLMTALGQP